MSQDRVRDECEIEFAAHHGDCSGFARAVAGRLGVPLSGDADEIVETLRSGEGWTLLQDGVAAAARAAQGKFVLGGLKGSEQAEPKPHGHVVVVVDGPLARNLYPTAYWGQLGGSGKKFTTTNFAWEAEDRDRVSYAEHDMALAESSASA